MVPTFIPFFFHCHELVKEPAPVEVQKNDVGLSSQMDVLEVEMAAVGVILGLTVTVKEQLTVGELISVYLTIVAPALNS